MIHRALPSPPLPACQFGILPLACFLSGTPFARRLVLLQSHRTDQGDSVFKEPGRRRRRRMPTVSEPLSLIDTKVAGILGSRLSTGGAARDIRQYSRKHRRRGAGGPRGPGGAGSSGYRRRLVGVGHAGEWAAASARERAVGKHLLTGRTIPWLPVVQATSLPPWNQEPRRPAEAASSVRQRAAQRRAPSRPRLKPARAG